MKQALFILSVLAGSVAQAQYTLRPLGTNESQYVLQPPGTSQSQVITRTISFYYKGQPFTKTFTFNQSDYNYYRSLRRTSDYASYATDHSSHPYLLQIAKVLDEDIKAWGYTDWNVVSYLTAFVQGGFPYVSESTDYPRYPIETIVDKGGDCEDTAILLAALLNMFGFDAILLNPPGHMAVGIACGNCDGSRVNYSGREYFYIETTGPNWQIGSMPYNYSSANIFTLSQVPRYKRNEMSPPPVIDEFYVQKEDGNNIWKRGNSYSIDNTINVFDHSYKGGVTTSNTTVTIEIGGIQSTMSVSGGATSITFNGNQVTIQTSGASVINSGNTYRY